MSATEKDLPIKVFSGAPAEVVFLASLLNAAGVETNLTGAALAPPSDIYVRRRDQDAAREIVNDFLAHGTRTGVEGKPADVLEGRWPREGES